MAWRAPARSISAEMSQISNTARSAEHAATTVPDLRFRSTRPSPARLASARLTVIRDTPKRAISACSDGTLRPGGHDPARIGRAIARRICRCSGPSPSSARSGSGVTGVPPRLSPPPGGLSDSHKAGAQFPSPLVGEGREGGAGHRAPGRSRPAVHQPQGQGPRDPSSPAPAAEGTGSLVGKVLHARRPPSRSAFGRVGPPHKGEEEQLGHHQIASSRRTVSR